MPTSTPNQKIGLNRSSPWQHNHLQVRLWLYTKVLFAILSILLVEISNATNISTNNTPVSIPGGILPESHKHAAGDVAHYDSNKTIVAPTLLYSDERLNGRRKNLPVILYSSNEITSSQNKHNNGTNADGGEPRHLAVISRRSYFRSPNSPNN